MGLRALVLELCDLETVVHVAHQKACSSKPPAQHHCCSHSKLGKVAGLRRCVDNLRKLAAVVSARRGPPGATKIIALEVLAELVRLQTAMVEEQTDNVTTGITVSTVCWQVAESALLHWQSGKWLKALGTVAAFVAGRRDSYH